MCNSGAPSCEWLVALVRISSVRPGIGGHVLGEQAAGYRIYNVLVGLEKVIAIIAKDVAGSKSMQPCVYILSSKRNGTLYVGVTSNLIKRVWEHKNDVVEGFSSKYHTHTLVWFELHETIESAIRREKAIKNWKRAWKIRAIEERNPTWKDLYSGLL